MPRKSQHAVDELTRQTVPLPLGSRGLDLRRPSEPGTLTELLNAQFQDARTIRRRDGHTKKLLQDRSNFVTEDFQHTNTWAYGHGTIVKPASNLAWENQHYPISVKGKGTFSFEGTEVHWTGDRLLVETDDAPFFGAHRFWSREDEDLLEYGVPAYLPVQTDNVPPVLFNGAHMDVCYTETLQGIAVANGDEGVKLVVVDRSNGSVIKEQVVGTTEAYHVRIVNSGGRLLAFWLDDEGFKVIRWNGISWDGESTIENDALTFDVFPLSGGCQLIWDKPTVPDVSSHLLKAGRFSEQNTVDFPHTFGTVLFVDDETPAEGTKAAITVAPNGDIAYVWASDNGLFCFSDTDTLSVEQDNITELDDLSSWHNEDAVFSVSYRGLSSESGRYSYVVHGSFDNGGQLNTNIWEVKQAIDQDASPPVQDKTVYNAGLLSKNFTVGDEVFAWLYSTNSMTSFLQAGVTNALVCGISERETTQVRASSNDYTSLRSVTKDPLAEFGYVWARPYDAGRYFRKGDTLIGDIDFMPSLSTAAFGRSVYLAGSLVRCWDGQELGDAGWHDYPVVTAVADDDAGEVDEGVHNIRVYPLRYNNRGERFLGAALTVPPVTVASGQTEIDLTIKTMPITNHDDTKFEIYMTAVGSTVFRYVDVVDNDKDAVSVSYTISISDADHGEMPGDPHAPGVDGLQELEEFGPVGCKTIVTAGDRLWGIGGQVPAGCAQFSKLYEVNEGVGFDAIASIQVMDATGAALTAITPFGDSTIVAFQEKKLCVLQGFGPDNFGTGSFSVPDLRISDGATNQNGLAVLPTGIVFWSSDGPRFLSGSGRVENISEPITSLARQLTPSGVRFNLKHNEVVWYMESGDALLWSYSSQNSRWARWSGVPAAGTSSTRVITPDGEVWTPASTPRDSGRRFTFKFETGNVRLDELLSGGERVEQVGLAGKYEGEHRPKIRVYYNNSPLYNEVLRWTPKESSWLLKCSEVAALTAAQIDALNALDKTGSYALIVKLRRQDCRFIRVSVSDCGDNGFTPWELMFTLASTGGSGRTAKQTITRNGE